MNTKDRINEILEEDDAFDAELHDTFRRFFSLDDSKVYEGLSELYEKYVIDNEAVCSEAAETALVEAMTSIESGFICKMFGLLLKHGYEIVSTSATDAS